MAKKKCILFKTIAGPTGATGPGPASRSELVVSKLCASGSSIMIKFLRFRFLYRTSKKYLVLFS
jgi:hypothetical protein